MLIVDLLLLRTARKYAKNHEMVRILISFEVICKIKKMCVGGSTNKVEGMQDRGTPDKYALKARTTSREGCSRSNISTGKVFVRLCQ